MAQRSKLKRFNSPQPTNVDNSGIVRNRDYNEVVLDIAELYSLTVDGGGSYAYVGNSSTNTNIDWSTATVQELNLDNNPTLTFSNGIEGKALTLLLRQQLLGKKTVSWPNSVIWSKGVIPSMQDLTNVSIDPNFLITTGANGNVSKIVLQVDGKILIGGTFISYNNTASAYIARINSNGTIDNTLNVGTGFNSTVNTLAIQADGKILVGGVFTSYDGNSVNKIIRINSNGSIDNTFSIGTGFDNDVLAIVIQSDGKIIVGGKFDSYDGNTIGKIVRLNSDGTIDNTFNNGTGFDKTVSDIGILADGSVIVVGDFTTYDGNSVSKIAKLSTLGVFDNTFTQGTGLNGAANTLYITSDNKIFVGGGFADYNGFSSSGLIKLNSSGTVDTSFNVGIGTSGAVYSINVQTNGKVLIGGNFFSYNGNPSFYLCFLNADGTLYIPFQPSIGPAGIINSIAIQPDNKILLGGNFFQFAGVTSPNISRVQESAINAYNAITFHYNGTSYIGSF